MPDPVLITTLRVHTGTRQVDLSFFGRNGLNATRELATDVITAGHVIVAVPGETYWRFTLASPEPDFALPVDDTNALRDLTEGETVTLVDGCTDATAQRIYAGAVVRRPADFENAIDSPGSNEAYYTLRSLELVFKEP